MRKILLLMAAVWATVTMTFAAKANSRPFTVRQADGTLLSVVLHGDESFSWYATADGVVLAPKGTSFYVAQVRENGETVPTAILAHEKDNRGAAEIRAARVQLPERMYAAQTNARKREMEKNSRAAASSFPHKGSPTVLVILAQFQDTVFHMADPVASFQQFFSGDTQADLGCGEARNCGSVKQYFSDMSQGQFTPQFKVVGPVTLPHELKYYGEDSKTAHDTRYNEFVKDACAQASLITDFSDPALDSDNDGNIDLVAVVYAGFGQNNGAMADAIWARTTMRSMGSYGGKNVMLSMCAHELNANEKQLKTVNPSSTGSFSVPQIAGIGVFCHEFSHAMGLPDLYATVSSAEINNQTMEYWSLMDGGEYVYNSYCPTAYTAWERSVMEWQQPVPLTADGTFTIKTYAEGGDSYQLLNGADENDCLIFENIQQTGWNRYLRGHGLLAYRVSLSGAVSPFTPLNNTAGKPGVTVVPADGLLLNYYTLTEGSSSERLAQYRSDMGGDPFPGTKGVTQLTAAQKLPNYQWRTGSSQIVAGLYNICEDKAAGTVTFTFANDVASGIQQVVYEKEPGSTDAVFSVDGRCMGHGKKALPHGVYIVKGKKVVR